MILEKFLIKSFKNDPQTIYEVKVPDGSVFTHVVKVLEDGIYAFFKVPSQKLIQSDFHNIHTFAIFNSGIEIPSNYDLVDILDVAYQVGDSKLVGGKYKQGIMLFPIYKKT